MTSGQSSSVRRAMSEAQQKALEVLDEIITDPDHIGTIETGSYGEIRVEVWKRYGPIRYVFIAKNGALSEVQS